MKATPDCVACIYRQALSTARVLSKDPRMHMAMLDRVAMAMRGVSPEATTPAGLSQVVYRIASELSGIRDPYLKIKQETNAAALRLLPDLAGLVRQSPDPLKAACRLAVAGNIIDFGIGDEFLIERDIKPFLQTEFAIDQYADFQRELQPGRRVLYLGDNSGEIVFDRVLIEYLLQAGMRPTFVVKSAPIINDVTLDDARQCGLADLVPVIGTGSDDIGIHWGHVSKEFQRAFDEADLVISKGHGNFETCDDHAGNFYFLLKAKCHLVANHLGVRFGDLIFQHRST